jgi:hypothetical protein
MAFLHVMWQITLLLCHISSKQKSRSFETLICVLISFWILSFYSRIVQGFSPKLSPKVKPPSPPKSPPRLLASPPYILESRDPPESRKEKHQRLRLSTTGIHDTAASGPDLFFG